MEILVIGSSNMDMVIGVDDIPVIGETVMGKSIQYITGGKGANQAYACGALGGNITFLSAVGKDDFGFDLKANLSRANVCVDYIRNSERPTGMAVIYVNKKGDNCIVVIEGANRDCNLEYLRQNDHLIEQCDYLLVQLEIPLESVFYAIERAHSLGKTVILNPAPAPVNGIPEKVYAMVDYITPNETELRKLTGIPADSLSDIKKAGEVLLGKGVKNVIVTLGSQGAMVINSEMAKQFRPPDIKVVDTTAAGDVFNAAIAVSLTEKNSIEDAVMFANIASTISVSRKGAQSSIPSREEVERFTKNHLSLSGIV